MQARHRFSGRMRDISGWWPGEVYERLAFGQPTRLPPSAAYPFTMLVRLAVTEEDGLEFFASRPYEAVRLADVMSPSYQHLWDLGALQYAARPSEVPADFRTEVKVCAGMLIAAFRATYCSAPAACDVVMGTSVAAASPMSIDRELPPAGPTTRSQAHGRRPAGR